MKNIKVRLVTSMILIIALVAMIPKMLRGQMAPGAGGPGGSSGGATPLESTIIIRETPENLLKIEQIIKTLDQPPKQVLIEAHIFDIALDDQNAAGLDWSMLMTQLGLQEPLWQFDQTLAPSGGNAVLRFGTLSNEHFTMLLRGLQKNNRARSLSNPKVTAMNGQNAIIEIGQKIPYITTNTTVSQGITVTNREVKFENVPINLSVTPTIYDDGTIRLRVVPTITALRSFVEGVPWTETRTANTDVIIRTGETLILGGLITESKSEDTNTIPVLGRIPYLKKIFTSVSKTNKRSELVVFITPHIIWGNQNSVLTTYVSKNVASR